MRCVPPLVLLWLLAPVGVGAASRDARPQSSTIQVRRALLIGINEYRSDWLVRLRGSLNDIETIRAVLTTRYGFAPEHIKTLTNEAATRAGILSALRQLVREAGPNDVLYIHYSGHGSQVRDLDGDEEDGEDETLVPYDGRTPGVPDITDDELQRIFSGLRTSTAVIALDACHSGTATRGGLTLATRSVPPDSRLDLYRQTGNPQIRARAVVPLIGERYVLMTAAAAHQSALDGPVGDGHRYHGFFSYALSRSLALGDQEISPRALLAGIERELNRLQGQLGLLAMPEPQLEAPRDRLDHPLFPPLHRAQQKHAPRLPWAKVRPLNGNRVVLENSVRLGALPGSAWAIYPPGETAFSAGNAIATASVTKLSGPDAIARASRMVPGGTRAIALAPPFSARRVPVAFVGVSPQRREQFAAVLRKRMGAAVEVVGRGQFARFVIDCAHPTDGRRHESCTVYGADGIRPIASLSAATDSERAEQVAPLLSRSASVAELLALDNPSSGFRVEVALGTAIDPRWERVGTRGVRVSANVEAAHFHFRKPGEPRRPENSLALRVRSSATCYLTIADVDSEGHVGLLFPNAQQKPNFFPRGRVPAGEYVLIPDSLAPGNRAGFNWDFAPPGGTDTLRVFCSTDLATAEMIRRYVRESALGMRTRGSGNARTSSSDAPLAKLRASLIRQSTRGLVVLAAGTGPAPPASAAAAPDWTATSLTLQVGD